MKTSYQPERTSAITTKNESNFVCDLFVKSRAQLEKVRTFSALYNFLVKVVLPSFDPPVFSLAGKVQASTNIWIISVIFLILYILSMNYIIHSFHPYSFFFFYNLSILNLYPYFFLISILRKKLME